MMPFEKPEKNMIFTEQNERKRDFSNVTFLKILLVEKFYFKIWSLVQISIQKLTRSFLNSKSDNLYNFVSKIGRTKSLIQKLTRGEVFDPKLIFCSFSSSSIKPLKKRINRRSSQLFLHDNWWILFIWCLFFFSFGDWWWLWQPVLFHYQFTSL